MAVTSQRCSDCLDDKKLDEFYMSSSVFHSGTGRIHVCKSCLWDYAINKDTGEVELDRVKDALRSIDKPFIMDAWISSLAEAEKRDGNVFRLYMKNIAMRHFKSLNYGDSIFSHEKELTEEEQILLEDEVEEIVYSKSKLKQLIRDWGVQSHQDYEFLEDFYKEYELNFPPRNAVERNLYKNIAKTHLNANKKIESGSIGEYEKLMKISSQLHTDANIKPVQSSGIHDDNGATSYGLWIGVIETEDPAEYFANKPIYEDFDGFRKYWEKWFIRPFKNIFKISKDFDVDLDEDNVPKTPIKKNDDEEEDI